MVATETVVEFSTSGSSGSAGLDAAMLVLDATGNTPNDYIGRSVDALVVSEEKEDVAVTPGEMSGERARFGLRRAAEGGEASPEHVDELTEAIVESIVEEAERQGATVDEVPVRIAFGTGTIQPDPEQPDVLSTELELPGFHNGELVDMLIVQEDARPIEVEEHPLGPDSPYHLTHTPLLGTIMLSAVPLGLPVDGERPWEVEVKIRRVTEPTQIVMGGVNVDVTPRLLTASENEMFMVRVDAYGAATVQARRMDTGESFSLSLPPRTIKTSATALARSPVPMGPLSAQT